MARSPLACAIFIGALAASRGEAAPGTLDPTFGKDGTVTTYFPNYSDCCDSYRIRALALQPDGRIVVAGGESWGPGFAVARVERDGAIDEGFAATGAVFFPGGYAEAFAVALQTDGKIVTAGVADRPGGGTFALARQASDGSLDSDFGNGGLVITDLPSWGAARAMALQPDGRIVAAGVSLRADILRFAITVVRYDADGALDPGFGSGGVVTREMDPLFSGANAVALQADGKIVAAGDTAADQSVLVRLNADGTRDVTFGAAGAVLETGTLTHTWALAIQDNGKILTAGTSAEDRFALVRHEPDGSLDQTFGNAGKVTTEMRSPSWNAARALALQPDGKIVAAGGATGSIAVVRYHVDGTLDATFGTSGIVLTAFDDDAEAMAVGIQPDGGIVAGGLIYRDTSNEYDRAVVARYLGDGPPLDVPATTTSTSTSTSTTASTLTSTTTSSSTSSSTSISSRSTSTSTTTIPLCSTTTCDDHDPCTVDRCDDEAGCASAPDPRPGIPCRCRRAREIIRCAPPSLARRLTHRIEAALGCPPDEDVPMPTHSRPHSRPLDRALLRRVPRMRVSPPCRGALRKLLVDVERATHSRLGAPPVAAVGK